jgi:hypothetical protein
LSAQFTDVQLDRAIAALSHRDPGELLGRSLLGLVALKQRSRAGSSRAGGAMGSETDRRELAEVIAAEMARSDRQGAVHRLIHGTDQPTRIAQQIDHWCRQVLGSRASAGIFHVVSTGSVTGVLLDDGAVVVVKAYQPRWSEPFLSAIVRAQAALVDAGLACAEPLAGPVRLGNGWATVERYLADPGQPPAFGDAEMHPSAQGLASLMSAAPWIDELDSNPLQQPAFDGLYPQPHSPLFDFEATAAGAEWIDEIAEASRPLLGRGRLVVAHTDWSARNVRLRADGVEAIYDMDSLAIVALPTALAIAAATWRSTGEASDAAAPGAVEIDR